jgi:hypothetical protein
MAMDAKEMSEETDNQTVDFRQWTSGSSKIRNGSLMSEVYRLTV